MLIGGKIEDGCEEDTERDEQLDAVSKGIARKL